MLKSSLNRPRPAVSRASSLRARGLQMWRKPDDGRRVLCATSVIGRTGLRGLPLRRHAPAFPDEMQSASTSGPCAPLPISQGLADKLGDVRGLASRGLLDLFAA